MDLRQALLDTFGFPAFRAGQAEAVGAALAGRDALVVMPTGAGKSLCYGLPALLRDDLTLVVSPLVSLMYDQVQALERVAPGRVGLVNAQRQGPANAATVAAAVGGELRALFVSPERFAVPRFIEAIRQARIGLFVVDEAHCVSQWGHDFRPDYFALADAARAVGAQATMALTATATPQVADDIARRLELRDAVRIATGFDRPNLSFSVIASGPEAPARIAAALAEPDALPAIVYAGTRDGAETLAASLARELPVEAIAYHAGLPRDERERAQTRLMTGEVPLVVATNAFGMGIDKANVRTVVHASVPGSLEALYQEAGRAGRDGLPARCLLFAQPRDKALHVHFIKTAQVSDEALSAVAGRLRSRMTFAPHDQLSLDGPGNADAPVGRYDLPLGELAAVAGTPRGGEDAARAILGHLARAGVIAPLPSAPDRAVGRMSATWGARELALARGSAAAATRTRWAQYRAVWEYVEGERCRRHVLLEHFGDRPGAAPSAGHCCDACAPLQAEWAQPGYGRRVRGTAVVRTAGRPASSAVSGAELDEAIVEVVRSAQPPVGRTRAVEILRGGRSKVIAQHGYDGLPGYGTFGGLRGEDVLARVDALLEAGTLRSSGGRFPKLRAAAAAQAA